MFLTYVTVFIVCTLRLSLCKSNNIMGENCTDGNKDYFCEEKLVLGDYDSTCYYPFKNVKDKCNFLIFEGQITFPCKIKFYCKYSDTQANNKGINLKHTVFLQRFELRHIFFQNTKLF